MARMSEMAILRRVLIALVAAYALIAQGVLGAAAHAAMVAGNAGQAGDPAHVFCLPAGGPSSSVSHGSHETPQNGAGHLPDCCMAGCSGTASALPAPVGASVAVPVASGFLLAPMARDLLADLSRPHERPLVRGPPVTA